jgi:hypothetical protein
MEPSQAPTRKIIDYGTLSDIDKTFRENYAQITEELAAVINKYLDPKNEVGYRVSAVTFAPPNPKLCVPYVRFDRVYGVVAGVSCFDV